MRILYSICIVRFWILFLTIQGLTVPDGLLSRGAQLGGAAGALAPPIILDFTK